MKEKLSGVLGGVGVIVFYLVYVAFSVIPVVVLDFPLWLCFIVFFLLTTVPFADILYFGVEIWAFIVALKEPSSLISILMFISFGLHLYTIAYRIYSSRHH